MYNIAAMIVIGIGSAVAGAVWKAKQKDKKFLDQLKALQPKNSPAPVKDAEVVLPTDNKTP